ncbi:MAG TPA: hypothetical protein PKM25_08560 [Candidatus Ozemobacteraceae bacterium]|nr:hypothetical protein [Candidatus Ozemobacteraceae bacterium]
MYRMIFWTAAVLCCLSLCLNMAFANRPAVGWGDLQLSERDVKLALKNEGSSNWTRFSVTVKVFEDKKLVTTGTLTQSRGLKAAEESILRFGLNKPLAAGRSYRVEAWLQSGSPQIVSREWRVSTPAGSTLRTVRPDKAFGMIPEPELLRHSIRTINVRAQMGI